MWQLLDIDITDSVDRNGNNKVQDITLAVNRYINDLRELQVKDEVTEKRGYPGRGREHRPVDVRTVEVTNDEGRNIRREKNL